MEVTNKFRTLPAIDKLLSIVADDPEIRHYPHGLVTACLRQAVANARTRIKQGDGSAGSADSLVSAAKVLLKEQAGTSLRRVINATGVVLHTNLGRAPLSKRAQACVTGIMEGYSTLEYTVESGQRGSRYAHVVEPICHLTGAEDALVVNNNAAAVLLVLAALARGREVIVSRGELVEIGGSFRVPDVLRQSGATLVEVGTTNKTHLADYEQAIGPNTAAILKVHTSNYCIIGFTSQPEGKELAALAHKHNLPVLEDLGSGTLLPLTAGGQTEPAVTERLQLGFDVLTFSGDKLLGAGQAGIIAGKRPYIELMKKHPLLRAVRIDKLSLAALEGTLKDYIIGSPGQDVPVLAMLNAGKHALEQRANRLKELIVNLNAGFAAAVVQLNSPAGGGALPAAVLNGYGVTVTHKNLRTEELESRLRQQTIPIVTCIREGKIIFDVRCLLEKDLPDIANALGAL